MIIAPNYKLPNQLLPLKPTITQTAYKKNNPRFFNVRNLVIQIEVWIMASRVNKKLKFLLTKQVLHPIAIETKSSNNGLMPRTNPKLTHIKVSDKILCLIMNMKEKGSKPEDSK